MIPMMMFYILLIMKVPFLILIILFICVLRPNRIFLKKFDAINEVKEYIEKDFIENYL